LSRYTTIFKQLILNVIIPALIALFFLAGYNYITKKKLLKEAYYDKHVLISDELINIMEFQDKTFEILSEKMALRMKALSDKLVHKYFAGTVNVEQADLIAIRKQLKMDPEMEDIYVINRDGIVVNTTFSKDLGMNLFRLGEEHKKHLLHILDSGQFSDERFTVEKITNRIKKYSYQPTLDKKYIIELGFYSKQAEDYLDFIRKSEENIVRNQKDIVNAEMFFMVDNVPYSFDKNAVLEEKHRDALMNAFKTKGNVSLEEHQNGKWLHYEYTYKIRNKTSLYKDAVIRVVSDRTKEKLLLRREFLRFLILLIVTLMVVTFLIYRKTKVITSPIERLVNSVNRISNGHLDERVEVIGNNEITTLSQKFNLMIEQLEVLYTELEEKVKERTAEVVKQKEEIEEQQRRITDSIKYAKRIQTAILPPQTYAKTVLKDYFILYKPKDIVSGDFYWMEKKDNLVMVAAVDCTGHGVPGAFMSIVGNTHLSFAVNVKKARTAARILNELNHGVTETLREKHGTGTVKDGMDIALCVIDKKNMTLDFAGANNPLCLIRNKELTLYKGDRFAIGAFLDGALPSFTNHRIDIKTGDTIYLFSDGYADQFGGPKNKKFLGKNLRNLLVEISIESMEHQKDILEKTFIEWQGENEQIDDILVMGIRF